LGNVGILVCSRLWLIPTFPFQCLTIWLGGGEHHSY
jgi:hypothetical protein